MLHNLIEPAHQMLAKQELNRAHGRIERAITAIRQAENFPALIRAMNEAQYAEGSMTSVYGLKPALRAAQSRARSEAERMGIKLAGELLVKTQKEGDPAKLRVVFYSASRTVQGYLPRISRLLGDAASGDKVALRELQLNFMRTV